MTTTVDTWEADFNLKYKELLNYANQFAHDTSTAQDAVHNLWVYYKELKHSDKTNYHFFVMIRFIILKMKARANGRISFKDGTVQLRVPIGIEEIANHPHPDDLEASILERDFNRQLVKFTQSLPVYQRRVFSAVMEGNSISEIATEFGSKSNTVKANYRNAYLKARKVFV